MGYYTAYGLEIYGNSEECDAFEKDLLEYTKEDDGSYDIEIQELINTGGTFAKLYDIEAWISAVAKRHPNVLIILSGDGEDNFDFWESRWKGDKYETQKAMIPPFETPELKTQSELNNN